MAELPRPERRGLAAGVGHGNLSVRIDGVSRAILRELPRGLPTNLPPASTPRSRKVGDEPEARHLLDESDPLAVTRSPI